MTNLKQIQELENLIIDLKTHKERLKAKTFGLSGSRKKGYTSDQIDRHSASSANKAKIRQVTTAIGIARLNLKLLRNENN